MAKRPEYMRGIEVRHEAACRNAKDTTRPCPACRASFRAIVSTPHGQQKSQWSPELEDAQRYREDMARRKRNDRLSKPTTDTLLDLADEFIEDLHTGRARSNRRKAYAPKTARQYEWSLRTHVVGTRENSTELGRMKVSAVRRRHIKAWLADMEFTHGPSQVNNALNPLRVLFARALDRELIDDDTNPIASIKSLPEEQRRPTIIASGEAHARIAALNDFDGTVWSTIFFGGLRIGEVRALTRASVVMDEKEPHLLVESGWDDVEGRRDTKTQAGARQVPMLPPLRKALAAYLLRTFGNADDPLFPGVRGESFDPSALRRRTYKAWEKAGFSKLEPHAGRHVYASWLIRDGNPLFIVSRAMGHSSTRVTERVYGHLTPGFIASVIERWNEGEARRAG